MILIVVILQMTVLSVKFYRNPQKKKKPYIKQGVNCVENQKSFQISLLLHPFFY